MVWSTQLNFNSISNPEKRTNFNRFLLKRIEVSNMFDFTQINPRRIKLEMLQYNNNSIFLHRNQLVSKMTNNRKCPSAKLSFKNSNQFFGENEYNHKTVDYSDNQEEEYSHNLNMRYKQQTNNKPRLKNNFEIQKSNFQNHAKRHSTDYIKLNLRYKKNSSKTNSILMDHHFQKNKGKVSLLNSSLIKVNHKTISLKYDNVQMKSLSKAWQNSQFPKDPKSNKEKNSLNKSAQDKFLVEGRRMNPTNSKNIFNDRKYSSCYAKNLFKNRVLHTVSTQYVPKVVEKNKINWMINNEPKSKMNPRIYKGLTRSFQQKSFSIQGGI